MMDKNWQVFDLALASSPPDFEALAEATAELKPPRPDPSLNPKFMAIRKAIAAFSKDALERLDSGGLDDWLLAGELTRLWASAFPVDDDVDVDDALLMLDEGNARPC